MAGSGEATHLRVLQAEIERLQVRREEISIHVQRSCAPLQLEPASCRQSPPPLTAAAAAHRLQNAVAHLVQSNHDLKAAIDEEGDDEDRAFKSAIEVGTVFPSCVASCARVGSNCGVG